MMRFPEQHRILTGALASPSGDPFGGAFMLPALPPKASCFKYLVIASNGLGWEHVSVSIYDTSKGKGSLIVPSWAEMCHIKDTFWDAEQTVMQLHPPKSEYVNNHEACLHLWRPTNAEIPRPNPLMVGVSGVTIKQ